MALSERKQKLLMMLVERHIREGQPIGSKALAQDPALNVSPATIRNLMAELEDSGILYSPHTSAGRVPTEAGYRLYVDSLLTSPALSQPHGQVLKKELSALLVPDQGRTELLGRASRVLAEITRMAGVVVVPKQEQAQLRQVEFLPLADRRVLVVLVLNRAEVQNRIIRTDREYSREELRQAANFINANYMGHSLDRVCDELLATLRMDKHRLDGLLETALDVAAKGLRPEEKEDDYLLAGESNLLGLAGEDELGKLRDLFDAFARKRDILHLLERASRAGGVQIFIGRESGHDAFADYSLVASTWQGANDALGVMAVVGPTRMDYERVIPAVDVTARVLSAALRNL